MADVLTPVKVGVVAEVVSSYVVPEPSVPPTVSRTASPAGTAAV